MDKNSFLHPLKNKKSTNTKKGYGFQDKLFDTVFQKGY